ncbi:MAG TPA: ABC transporter ATP-binding protein [Trueperaceae bacterium]|nr:ABC transporter ATP-binding protein [Trueperaceae bacterium]
MTTRAATTDQPVPTEASMLAMLRRYLAPQRGMALLMAVLLLAATGLQLLVPQIMRRFIDGALAAAPGRLLTSLAVSFLAVAVVTQLLNALATYVAAAVGWRATNHLREDLTRHTLDLDMGFHNARTAGEMIERIDGDITSLSNFLSQFSVRVFGGLLLLVGILVALWLEEPLMGGALTAFVVLELVALTLTRRVGVPASNLEREANARQFGFIEERLQGLDDLRANGAGEYSLHRFRGGMRGVYRDTRRAWMLRSVVWLSSYGLFVVGLAVSVGTSIYLVRRGDMTVGAAYMVFQYLFMLQNPIEQITQQLQELQKAAAGVQRVGELFRTRSALPPGGTAELPAGPLAVTFEGVDFHYLDASADQLTLRGVSFHLAPGRRLGLLGRTGSGKTTLTRLVFRLYDPSGGSVKVGGVDTREVDLQRLRSRIGLVTQDVQLFRGSLRDNLTFFDPSVPDEVIVGVLEELGLGPWLRGQERGLDTELDSGGRNLSAGEAQLIAFARVFLKDPGLVILDEPSSRLDPVTERRLEVALERLLHGRTAIVIAHRLETVERVDEIMVMERGRVVEAGPRAVLAADEGSRYARLRRAALALDLNVAGRAGAPQLAPEDAELLEDLA